MRSTILTVALFLICISAVLADPMDDCFKHLSNARQLRDQGQYTKAFAEVSTAMRVGGSGWRPHCFYDRSQIWLAMGQYDKAIADAEEALKPVGDYRGEFRTCRKYLGELWLEKGDYDQAIANFDIALELKTSVVSYWDGEFDWRAEVLACRAEARSKKGDYDGAIEDFNEALHREPHSASTLQKAAWFRATCPNDEYRSGERAFANARRAYKVYAPEYAGYAVIDTLAAAYAESGDFASAIQWEEKVIESNPRKFGFKAAAEKRLQLYKAHKPYRDEPAK